MSAEPEKSESGRVVTFYSYKGGVGRSLALANVAALLARWGKKVLVIDWDLEAPGIEKYLEPDSPERQPLLDRRRHPLADQRRKTPGVVDLVLAYRDQKPLDWRDCLLRVEGIVPEQALEPIDILSAGQDVPEYAERLRSINWEDLFENHDFGNRLEEWRSAWMAAYDFVLVDSRTGITDIGGICTIHLPDVLVALFTTNEQSVAGVKQVMAQARAAQERLPVARFRLSLVPVPARDESVTEHVLSQKWRDVFARELGPFYESWLPEKITPRDVLERLKIPYKAYWSFGERLPALLGGVDDPASPGYAYNMLAKLIASGLDLRSQMDTTLRATAAERETAMTRQKSRRVVTFIAGAMISLILMGSGLWVWGARKADRERKLARVNSIVAAVQSSSDPVEQALLLTELDDLPETPEAMKQATALLSQFPNPHVVIRGETTEDAQPRFSADGKYLSTVSKGRLRIWNTDGHGSTKEFPAGSKCVAKWDPTGKRLLLVCDYDRPQLIDLLSGAVPIGPENRKFVSSICADFSPDGRKILLCDENHGLTVVDLQTHEEQLLSDQWAVCGGFTDGGKSVTVRKVFDRSERVELATGKVESFPLPKWDETGRLQVFCPDDASRLALSNGKQLAIWKAVGPPAEPEMLEVGPYDSLRISQDAVAVVTDGKLRVMTRAGSIKLFETKRIRWVHFDHGGNQVLAGADDGSVMGGYFGPETALYLLRHPSFVSDGYFSPDSKQIVTVVPADSSVRIWRFDRPPAPPSNWEDALKSLRGYTTACLLPRQRTKFLGETPDLARTKYDRCERGFDRTPLTDKDLDIKSGSGSTNAPF